MISNAQLVSKETQRHAHGTIYIEWERWVALLASASTKRRALHALLLCIAALTVAAGVVA